MNESINIRDFRFTQRCCLGFCCLGLLRRIEGLKHLDVSTELVSSKRRVIFIPREGVTSHKNRFLHFVRIHQSVITVPANYLSIHQSSHPLTLMHYPLQLLVKAPVLPQAQCSPVQRLTHPLQWFTIRFCNVLQPLYDLYIYNTLSHQRVSERWQTRNICHSVSIWVYQSTEITTKNCQRFTFPVHEHSKLNGRQSCL